MARTKYRLKSRRFSFRLSQKSIEQMETLADALSIPRSAVISQALARMFRTERVTHAERPS